MMRPNKLRPNLQELLQQRGFCLSAACVTGKLNFLGATGYDALKFHTLSFPTQQPAREESSKSFPVGIEQLFPGPAD